MDTVLVDVLKVVAVLAPVVLPRLLMGRAQQQRLAVLLPRAHEAGREATT
ncbi:MAG TPA: hypothetical protein VFJ94_08220 [Intrasporangium sp.]|nr:hypothetical protein [Intrasporangium sp.]HET7398494.1 hypothetical protein [Intrasporangium sp.]